MKRDETKVTKKSVRKMNIDDLPVNDGEDFEFHPDFDEFGFFEEPETKEEYLASQEDFSGSAEDLGEYMRGMEAPSGKQRIKKLKLTPEEIALYRRGRNTRLNTTPKHATHEQYAKATGLETLFGALYLSGQTERINTLFTWIMEDLNAI